MEQAQPARLAILQEYVPGYRAAFFSALRDQLDRQGVELIVAAGKPGPRAAARMDADASEVDVRIRQIEFRLFGRRVTLRLMPHRVRSADMIVCEQARRNLDLYVLLTLPVYSRRVALWGHGIDRSQRTGRLRFWLLNWLTRRAAHIFVYTHAGLAALEAAGYPSNEVTVVRNTVDTSSLLQAYAAVELEEARRWARGLAGGPVGPVFAFIGAVDSAKGIELLLEAWKRVVVEFPDGLLLVAGEGQERGRLQKESHGLRGLRFLGHVGVEDKVRVLKIVSAVVVPGQIGLLAVECLSVGVPIVTVSGVRHGPEFDYLSQGSDAIVVPGNPVDIAEAMTDIASKDRRVTLCEGLADWSIEGMAERFAAGVTQWRQTLR